MKRFFLLFTVLLGMCAVNYGAFAQDNDDINPLEAGKKVPRIFWGPSFGINRAMHSVTLQTFNETLDDQKLCPAFKNGSGSGIYGGLSVEFILGDPANSNSSIIARGLFNSLPTKLEENGGSYPSRLSDGKIINSVVNHVNEVKYNLATVEVCYKFNPFTDNLLRGLGFTIGPTFDFAMTKTQDQRMMLVSPTNVQFEKYFDPKTGKVKYKYLDNDRTIVAREGDITGSSSMRIGLKAGVQYEIILKNGFFLVPAIHYNFGVTNLSSDLDWRVNALQIGADLRFSI